RPARPRRRPTSGDAITKAIAGHMSRPLPCERTSRCCQQHRRGTTRGGLSTPGGRGSRRACLTPHRGISWREGMPARRQTRGRTRRALRALDMADRQRVLDWWSLAERRMKTPDGDPSAPAEAVGMSTLIALVGLPERAVPLWTAARAGYAL